MRKNIFIIGLLLFITKTTAQNVLTGTVFLKGQKVVDAKIACIDPITSALIAETRSDFEGYYNFKVNQKQVIVKALYLDLPEFIDTVKIEEAGITYFNILLREVVQSSTINIKVNKKALGGETLAGVRMQESSAGTLNVVTREEFTKINATKGTDVLKRIPGTTIVEGKFANIRGMNDRYNAGYLNGAPMPATESDRKAFSFDIIPANLIDNIVILKAGTPNLTGDFGGGIIQINTRSIPDKRVQNFGFGLQYHSLTTFKNVETFDNGNMESLGMIDKNHRIPDLNGKLNGTAAENSAQTGKFNNNWSTQTIRPSLAPRFNYSIGLPVKINKKKELGVIASVNYSYSPKYTVGDVRAFDLSDNRKLRDFSDRIYNVNVQNGGLLNLSFKFNNRNRIDLRNLYNINYDASSNFRTGLTDADDQKYGDAYSAYSNQNQLFNSQLSGTHSISTKVNSKNQLLLTWNVNSSSTKRFMPDYRIAQYSTFDTSRIFVFNDFFNAGSGRFFSSLKEATLNATVDLAYTFEFKKITNALKGGLYAQNRERTFTSRRFVYGPLNKFFESRNTPATDLTYESMVKHGIYLIEKTSKDLDEYDGTSTLYAGYAMMENEIPFIKSQDNTKNIKLIYGVRLEQFEQKLNNDAFRHLNKWLSNQGALTDVLPSFNFVIPASLTTQVRGGYYKSLNRPEMRELAPFSFYNFGLNSEILGNTLLKRAEIHNFDLRYELYNGGSNTITLGVFYKKIINPIEMSLDPTQPGIRTFTYKNEKMAEVNGLEIEARQNLGKLFKIKRKSLLNDLTLYTNFALIKSKVSFFSNSTGTPNRSLQGQSPFVSNTSLFYESKKGFVLNLNFNKIGDRIAYIGTPKSIQPFGLDIYEFGRNIFDIQTGFNFGKGKNKNQQIRLNISDLFAQRSIFYQDNNQNKKFDDGDNELISLKNGRTITLNYSISF